MPWEVSRIIKLQSMIMQYALLGVLFSSAILLLTVLLLLVQSVIGIHQHNLRFIMKRDFLWVEKYRPRTIDECILPENIKLIPGSYDVQISKKNLAKFTNSNYNLDYFIALEPDSTYA